jgi:hypothetical protein
MPIVAGVLRGRLACLLRGQWLDILFFEEREDIVLSRSEVDCLENFIFRDGGIRFVDGIEGDREGLGGREGIRGEGRD